MRSVELARAAAQAEALRVRLFATRQAMRGAFGAVAAVFGLAILVMLHVILYLLLVPHMHPVIAALIVLVVDLVVAIVFAMLAKRNQPSQIEREARLLRDQSLAELRASLTVMSLAGSATGLILRRRAATSRRGRVLGALASRILARR